jgi:hypothetical protein
MSGLSYEFTDKEVSPWGGLRLIEEVYRKSGLKDFLENECPDLPVPGSNRGYYSTDLIEEFMFSVIFEQKSWFPQDDGYWTTSFQYKAHGWDAPRRMVVVRKDVRKHPSTGGRLLFPKIKEFERYRYAAFVTNMDLSAELIWHLYNKRADCENRIRELRNDYGIDGFCVDDFYATEAAFRWTMVAHNLMSLFRLQVLNHKHHPVLSTMKFQCIAIGSYLVKSGRKTVLKLSAKQKRKQFLEGLFQKLGDLSPPFQMSNA